MLVGESESAPLAELTRIVTIANVASDARSPASHAQVRLRIANPDAVCCLTLPVWDESLAALRCGGSEARCA